ncbi:DNA-directed RNA polymerases I and III subunit RPAC2 [Ceratocystis lukuohia]|uniref:DNA-directed RNA polymerases I and III subunit RPAC2 n=3 Tax=Ceratocystis TaxID=5157 RepID=A0A0F8AY02_CERFI|nr:DNA-directed RNA polymerases I and III subunit RPAC2 [Ceratocystis platani]PHH53545.1 DNA-directed RNA polymerases I and III subunit RPAC2 [Ceratocystis fimbriata CBS 114723]
MSTADERMQSEDVSMEDAPPAMEVAAEEAEEAEEELPQRVRILPGSDDRAASFEFLDEGHTLGNALRWVIMKNPDVEFCAYAIPHPSEAKMNIRIQTYDGFAVNALRKGLNDLAEMCDVMADKFTNSVQGTRE